MSVTNGSIKLIAVCCRHIYQMDYTERQMSIFANILSIWERTLRSSSLFRAIANPPRQQPLLHTHIHG